MMLLNEVCHQLFVGIKCANGPRLVLTHEATVTLDIRTEDGSELAFNFLCGHLYLSSLTLPYSRFDNQTFYIVFVPWNVFPKTPENPDLAS
jgi:hypothetical protein